MARLLSRTFKSLKSHPNSPLPNPANSLQKQPQIVSLSKPSSSQSPPVSPWIAHSNSPLPNPAGSPRKQPQVISLTKPSSSQSPPVSTWIVYLILSTNPPIKTYVGVTTNFSRRLKQHNGELKGGAEASRAGRPWICACLVEGFNDKSEAYEFEAKWKSFSRKSSRKRKGENLEQTEKPHLLLLQHRYVALNHVKESIDCDQLEVNWHVDPV